MSGTGNQQEPALIFPGPVALVAGPGSGKTTRIAMRIKHLVEDRKVSPHEIAVITFTVEAARNMKARLTPPARDGMPDVTLPPERHPPMICTMHSLGARIIAENFQRLEITPGYRLIASWQARQTLFEDAARLCGESFEFGRECDQKKRTTGAPATKREERVFNAYAQILRACNAIDHDDQIVMACQLLREHDDILEYWRQKATHLLVDEYQDINRAQLELIQLLSAPESVGLFVVGDDDQSIYRFRGADPTFIRDFQKHFGDQANVVPIPDCFRCQHHVIKAAHGFIAVFNPDRIPKPEPEYMPDEGLPVVVHDVPSDTREAEIIATIVAKALLEGAVLVLVPRRGYEEPLQAELRKRRIAFDVAKPPDSDATLIFKALRDWLVDQADNLAFRMLLRAITDGGMLDIPGRRAWKPKMVAEREDSMAQVSALWNGVFAGASLRESLHIEAQTNELCGTLDGAADTLAQATSGTPTEFAQCTFEALRPWPNSARMLDELASSPTDNDGPRDGDANLVRIMTMRHAKGLEADAVFVIGLEEGAFPDSEYGTGKFEEDARLFYVSMTRAKKELYLFHARKRSGAMTFKQGSFNTKASPFIGGLPKEHRDLQYHPSATQRGARKKGTKGSGLEL